MDTIEVVQYGIKVNALKHDNLIVADWFACKKFKEYGRNFDGFDNRVFAIIGETEKAYNLIIGSAFNHVATWCPKSLVSVDKEPNENDITLVCNFDTAMEVAKSTRKFFA